MNRASFIGPILGNGLGVPAVAVWTPASLGSTLKGWWDFSDVSKLWQNSGRSTPVAADGDPIGACDDKSGNGKHAVQATAGNRPTYKTGIQNSQSVGQFDGAASKIVAPIATTSTVLTMWCVVKATANGGKFFSTGATAGSDGAVFNQNVSTRDFLAEFVANQPDGAMSHAAFEVWVGTVSAAPLWVLRVNAAGQTLTPNNSAMNAPTTDSSIGGTNALLTGYIGECGVCDTVLSAGNITSLESYLNTKWAVY